MEPNISEGLVIAEGGLLLLRQALFWTIVYYSTGGKRGVYYDMGVGDEAFASPTVIVDEKMANGNMIAECFAKTTSTNPLFLSRSD